MVAALELYLDHIAERRVRVLWEALEREGVQSMRDLLGGRHRPHLSLAVADELDAAAVKEALDGYDPAPPLRVQFLFTGWFVGRVLWLGAAPSVALLAHQAEVWRRLSVAGIPLSEKYTPGAWVPHCTVSMRVARPLVTEATRRCLEVLPITATVRAAAVADHARDRYDRL
ncbi:2'-5' RNA ligase [Virgisporangium aliadipatigenens]|uniref:2'-5' RNA ligase n=1 Tax=Virgisporangium aliadipatigenens TaxID=741659 RepID=A0A8J3YWT1_9ACTN|nr:2'-5' RNA ligase family protein [Virgisporangium aliadipatigenens]GIJ51113.1 2'-5' RNA ligase [Virgisporangium aliadipatigenens]